MPQASNSSSGPTVLETHYVPIKKLLLMLAGCLQLGLPAAGVAYWFRANLWVSIPCGIIAAMCAVGLLKALTDLIVRRPILVFRSDGLVYRDILYLWSEMTFVSARDGFGVRVTGTQASGKTLLCFIDESNLNMKHGSSSQWAEHIAYHADAKLLDDVLMDIEWKRAVRDL